jgi:hypothetical protein
VNDLRLALGWVLVVAVVDLVTIAVLHTIRRREQRARDIIRDQSVLDSLLADNTTVGGENP